VPFQLHLSYTICIELIFKKRDFCHFEKIHVYFCKSISLGSLVNQSRTYQGNPCGAYPDLSFISGSGVIQILCPIPSDPLLIRITSRAKKPLELIYADFYGTIKPMSLGKNNYFLLFIDDFSRKMWVCFLKKKSKVFSAFKKFKAVVEKESGQEIKAMRTD